MMINVAADLAVQSLIFAYFQLVCVCMYTWSVLVTAHKVVVNVVIFANMHANNKGILSLIQPHTHLWHSQEYASWYMYMRPYSQSILAAWYTETATLVCPHRQYPSPFTSLVICLHPPSSLANFSTTLRDFPFSYSSTQVVSVFSETSGKSDTCVTNLGVIWLDSHNFLL